MDSGVIIRHMVLPGHKEDSIRLLHWIAETLPQGAYYISLLSQYTPFYHSSDYPELNRRITTYEYQKVVDTALELGLDHGFMQEKAAPKKNIRRPSIWKAYNRLPETGHQWQREKGYQHLNLTDIPFIRLHPLDRTSLFLFLFVTSFRYLFVQFFLYTLCNCSLYFCYSTNCFRLYPVIFSIFCYPVLKYIILITLSRHITKTILFNSLITY